MSSIVAYKSELLASRWVLIVCECRIRNADMLPFFSITAVWIPVVPLGPKALKSSDWGFFLSLLSHDELLAKHFSELRHAIFFRFYQTWPWRVVLSPFNLVKFSSDPDIRVMLDRVIRYVFSGVFLEFWYYCLSSVNWTLRFILRWKLCTALKRITCEWEARISVFLPAINRIFCEEHHRTLRLVWVLTERVVSVMCHAIFISRVYACDRFMWLHRKKIPTSCGLLSYCRSFFIALAPKISWLHFLS